MEVEKNQTQPGCAKDLNYDSDRCSVRCPQRMDTVIGSPPRIA